MHYSDPIQHCTDTARYRQIREPILDSLLFSYLGTPLSRPIVTSVMQANPLRGLGDKGLNIGIRPYTDVGLAKETKAQKRGVGGPVAKSLICSPEALAQADELELAEEPKRLSRSSC